MPRRSVSKRAGPTCASGVPTWWNNARGSTPCDVYQGVLNACNYTAPALTSRDAYYPAASAQTCMCNTVAYNLGSACQDCQRGSTDQGILFSVYTAGGDGCPTTSTVLPETVTPTDDIPVWAFIDTSTQFWTYFDAQQVALNQSTTSTSTSTSTSASASTQTETGTATSMAPTLTISDPASSSATPTSVSSSSSKSVNAAAIGGGVAGGVVLVLLLIGAFVFLRRRRARDSHGGTVMGDAGGRGASSDSSLTEGGKVGGSSGSHYTPHSQMAQLNHSGGSGIIIPAHSTASALTTPTDAPTVPAIPREYATSIPARSQATSPTPSGPAVQKVKRVPVRYSEDEIAQAEEAAKKVAAQTSSSPH